MPTNSVFPRTIFSGLKNEPLFSRSQTSNLSLSAETNVKETTKDLIIRKPEVTLAGKSSGMPVGEHLMRRALEKIASEYGLDSSDIELEIQYVKDKKDGKFIENLSFGKKEIKNPDALTDPQVADLISKGNKTVNFGIHGSTVERMVQRNEIVKWLAQRDALNIPITEQDITDLKRFGYTLEDVGKIRDAKYMQYLGFREKALADVNEVAKQKLIADRVEYLTAHPEEVIKDGDNVSASKIDFLTRATATKEINDALTNSKMSALEYTADKKNYEQSLAELRDWETRTANMPTSTYVKEGGKNLVNSFYWGIGETLKGLAVLNEQQMIRPDGKQTKVSNTLGYKIGDWIQQNVQAPNVDKDIERTFAGGVLPKTVGGLLPAVFGAWATKSPTAAVSIYDGLRTGGSIYDEAKSKGATETQAQNTALLTGGFVGLTDRFGYGKTLETLNSGAGATTWRAVFKEAVKDSGRNAGVAGVQTIFENGVARQTYDPKRSYLKDVEQRMMAAGITGATLKGGLDIIAKVKAGKNPQVLAETQKIFKIEPKPQVEVNGKQIEFRNSGIDLKAKLNEKLSLSEQAITQQPLQREAVKLVQQAKISEPKIMSDLEGISRQTNGELVGLDHRFKSEESLTRKIADRSSRVERALIKQGRKPAEASEIALNETVAGINDTLRYTMSFPKERYYSGYEKAIETLKKQGYKIEAATDFWNKAGTTFDTGYRGINTTLISPGGQKFELQFHTPESFKLKMDTHSLYEEARMSTTPKGRKNKLRKIQIEMGNGIPVPVQDK